MDLILRGWRNVNQALTQRESPRLVPCARGGNLHAAVHELSSASVYRASRHVISYVNERLTQHKFPQNRDGEGWCGIERLLDEWD